MSDSSSDDDYTLSDSDSEYLSRGADDEALKPFIIGWTERLRNKHAGLIRRLSRNNEVPPESVVHDLKEITEHTMEYVLPTIDEKLSHYIGPPSRFSEKSEMLTEAVQSWRDCLSIISPIRRLTDPKQSSESKQLDERIIAQIFYHSLDAPDGESVSSLNVRKGVWSLGRVCRRWRRVALTLPALWSYVNLDTEIMDVPDDLTREELAFCSESLVLTLNTYLHRSGDHPLVLSCRIQPTWNPKISSHLFQSLVSHCHRWKEVTLYLPMASALMTALSQVEGNLPSLNRLSIRHFDDSDSAARSTSFFKFLSEAPSLRVLLLDDTGSSRSGSPGATRNTQPSVPVEGAKTIRASSVSYPPKADTAVVSIANPWTLPNLTSLGLKDLSITDTLVCPLLKDLTIQALESDDLRRISQLVRRSSCSIKSLRISGEHQEHRSSHPFHITSVGHHTEFSMLTSLQISNSTYDCAFFSELTIRENERPMFPNLMELKVQTIFEHSSSFDPVLKMLESRCRPKESTSDFKRLSSFFFTGHVDNAETIDAVTDTISKDSNNVDSDSDDVDWKRYKFRVKSSLIFQVVYEAV